MRILFSILLVCLNPVSAWYFPEHAIITQKAVEILPSTPLDILKSTYEKMQIHLKKENFEICENFQTPFFDSGKKNQDNCIPFNSWPAMAGDHSNDIEELSGFLKKPKNDNSVSLKLVKGSQQHWKYYLGRMAKEKGKLSDGERRNLIRRLDIFLTITDPGYLKRAQHNTTHFSPGDENFKKTLEDLKGKGRLDNSLNQFIVHHLRSLQFAKLSHKRPLDKYKYTLLAFLEHSFALHFFQDGFASGHIVMYDPYLSLEGNYSRLRRHDYFNRRGLPVTKLLSPSSCAYIRLKKSELKDFDIGQLCWTTYGDGFLEKGGDVSLFRAARGMTKVQIQLAMAFNPKAFEKYTDQKYCKNSLTKPDFESIYQKTTNYPEFLSPIDFRIQGHLNCEEKSYVIKKALKAMDILEKSPLIKKINSNSNTPVPEVVDAKIVGHPFKFCQNIKEGKIPKKTVAETKKYCPKGQAINMGNPGTSLLRPFVSSWPVPQSNKSFLYGNDPFNTGLSYQFGLTLPFLYTSGGLKNLSVGANFQLGLSYRLANVVSSNPNLAILEVLLGLYNSVGIDKKHGTHPQQILTLDVRTVFLNLAIEYLFQKTIYHLFIKDAKSYNNIINFFDVSFSALTGVRFYHQLVSDDQKHYLGGFDIEVFSINIPQNKDVYMERFINIPTQIRLRIGRDRYQNAFTYGLEVAFGISRVF